MNEFQPFQDQQFQQDQLRKSQFREKHNYGDNNICHTAQPNVKTRLITASLFNIITLLFLCFKDFLYFSIFNMPLERETVVFLTLMVCGLSFAGFIASCIAKMVDKAKEYYMPIMYNLYFSSFLVVQSIYYILLFYFGK